MTDCFSRQHFQFFPFLWFILLLGILSLPHEVNAQKAIQLEKAGSLSTRKFFVGDELTYRLRHDRKTWLTEIITDIHMEDNMIQFSNRIVALNDIYAIRTGDGGKVPRILSSALTAFSGIWTFWTLVSLAYGDPLAISTVAIGAGSFIVGKLLKLAFFKTHRITGKKRLRLIDLTFYQVPGRSMRT